MAKSKIIESTFDKNISKEEIYSNVIKMYEGRKAVKIMSFRRVAFVCLIGIFLTVIGLVSGRNTIYYNELKDIGIQTARNSNGVYIDTYFSNLEKIVLPENVEKIDSYIVYENGSIDKNVVNYFGDDIEINIYFSPGNLSIQGIESVTNEKSEIKGNEVSLYKYENIYIAVFNYDDLNYQIRACNMSEKDFIIMLKSIIK